MPHNYLVLILPEGPVTVPACRQCFGLVWTIGDKLFEEPAVTPSG